VIRQALHLGYLALAFEGRLANDVRLFGARTLGVEVRARARRADARPFVERAFDPALAALLRRGWSEAQYQEVVQAVVERERDSTRQSERPSAPPTPGRGGRRRPGVS
jgi:hypothetical protein